MAHYAPGMRLIIRGEEWLVKRVDKNSFGSYTLTVNGLSRLVKDKESIFISELEDIITINPEETKLVPDKSAKFINSRLHMESLLRRKSPTDNKLHVGHKAAMDTLDYQLKPALIALSKPRQRILIADAVGLGKTLEAGILMSELIHRGKGKRILVVTVKSMMTQFQKEMWNRFSIPLEGLDSQGIQRIRSRIPSNHNPFNYFDKTIVSIDTLKRDSEYRNYLEDAWWDIIVIDEAHNVAERGNNVAQRARLAKLLSERSDTLIMLSATPHDGRAKSFASLMNMLEPTAIANVEDYTKEDIKDLCIRRFKKDIQDQVQGNFKERKIYKEKCIASSKEEDAFDYFTNITFKTIGGGNSKGDLFKTTLEKSLFSSPAACIATLKNRINKLSKEVGDDVAHDLEVTTTLRNLLEDIKPQEFSRYKKLVDIINSKEYGWTVKESKDRIVIFTERIETLKFLYENLQKDLNLKSENIAMMHGSMNDIELQKMVDDFGREESKLRILVASDVASEGINLHYLSHRLIHFDIPWSLMVFQQRNGRIDRYGQENTPDIRYLITDTNNEKIKGDMRILEVLTIKEEQATKNIGDPASLMNVYDSQEEEKITARAMNSNMSAEEFDKMLTSNEDDCEFDFMSLLMGEEDEDTVSTSDKQTESLKTLFTDIDYLKKSLDYFNNKEKIKYKETYKGIDITLNDEIKSRVKDIIPNDAMPTDDVLRLSTSIEIVQNEIKKSRQEKIEEKAWPKVQYLWQMHPIIEWLNDKSSTLFERQEAPVLGMSGVLDKDETIFIISGLIPNRKSHPMINEWFGVIFKNNEFKEIISMDELLKKVKLNEKEYSNIDKLEEADCIEISKLLPQAINKAKILMDNKLKEFEADINPKLNEQLKELEKLKGRHYEQLSMLTKDEKVTLASERKKEKKQRKIDQIFDDFKKWIKDTMTLENNPYVQVISVLTEVK